MLYCHGLEIFNTFLNKEPTFLFGTGPANYRAGPAWQSEFWQPHRGRCLEFQGSFCSFLHPPASLCFLSFLPPTISCVRCLPVHSLSRLTLKGPLFCQARKDCQRPYGVEEEKGVGGSNSPTFALFCGRTQLAF